MAQIDNRYAQAGIGARTDVAVDEGLRAYMLRVYNYMAAGIALTGVVAYVIFTYSVTTDPALAASAGGRIMALHRGMYLTPFGQTIFTTPAQVGAHAGAAGVRVLPVLAHLQDERRRGADRVLAVRGRDGRVAVVDLPASTPAQSITQVFFVTAAAFGALSLYGYTTKKDLSGWGSFLIMGVIGIIIAALVNLFLQSSALQFAISVIGVLVFAGLTAYDTQRIKDGYYEVMGDATATAKAAIMGALNLYLDFINMFTMLLQLFGNRE